MQNPDLDQETENRCRIWMRLSRKTPAPHPTPIRTAGSTWPTSFVFQEGFFNFERKAENKKMERICQLQRQRSLLCSAWSSGFRSQGKAFHHRLVRSEPTPLSCLTSPIMFGTSPIMSLSKCQVRFRLLRKTGFSRKPLFPIKSIGILVMGKNACVQDRYRIYFGLSIFAGGGEQCVNFESF